MAERRMFAKTIVMSDAFLDMPLSARCLYFSFGMVADDDGFVNNPKSQMRQIGASTDDLNLLVAKKFVIAFENGVICIKHWRINNYLRNDRYKESTYTKERASLRIEANGAYVVDNSRYTSGIPGGIPSIDKKSKEEKSVEKDSIGECSASALEEFSTPDDVASSEDLKSLFYSNRLAIQIDCKPIFSFEEYETLVWALCVSSFARNLIRTLSLLHKKAKELKTGQWTDFNRKTSDDQLTNDIIEHWGEIR
ncbi:MAG: hypothetical protein IJ033_02410 [Clostridia bacterium]|nr:hypothetical protein [Clostridia bacterium]